MLSDYIFRWLKSALDYGLSEEQFWSMTIAEIIRHIESKKRLENERLREKAVFDYTLANLIGKSVARIYHNSNTMPDISEVYPSLFDSEEIEEQKQERKKELSTARFRQFAQSFNNKFKGVNNG